MRARSTLIAISALIFGCSKAPAEEPAPVPHVKCVAAVPAPVDESLSLRGRIASPPGGDLSVASQVAGRIEKIVVKEGQHIKTGDVVARVDDVASRDGLLLADAQLAQAKAEEGKAKNTLERTRALVAEGISPRQELDDAVSALAAAKAATAAAASNVDLARRTLGRVEVRTNLAGVVTKVLLGPGALVDGTATTPIIRLATTSDVEFVAEATGRELALLRDGQSAHIELPDANTSLDGTVRALATALDPSTGLAQIRVAIPAGAPSLPMGTFGSVVIATQHREGVLQIPVEALRGAVADGAQVVACKDGHAEIRTVKTGWRGDKTVEIVSGVAPGERVAVDHVLGLDDGAAILEAQ